MPQVQIISSCPRCESVATGIIKYNSSVSAQKEMLKGANAGYHVIVRPLDRTRRFDVLANRFCTECRYEWYEDDCEKEKMSANDYREYLEERGLWNFSVKNQKSGFIMRVIKKAAHKLNKRKGE